MINKNSASMLWRTTCKDLYIRNWFNKRIEAAISEYETKMLGHPFANAIVYYKGIMFNPTGRKVDSKNMFTVPNDSPVADILDRHIRIKKDIEDATGALTYILNFCDSITDFKYLMNREERIDIPHLNEFKTKNADKFQLFKKYELMKDLV